MGAPPYRPRLPSGHDVPIPESVFQALHDVQHDVRQLTQAVGVYQASTEKKFADLGKEVTAATASWKDKAVTTFGGIALAAIAAFGGTRLATPSAPPQKAPEVRLIRGDRDVQLDECRELPAGSTDRAQCFRRVNADAPAPK